MADQANIVSASTTSGGFVLGGAKLARGTLRLLTITELLMAGTKNDKDESARVDQNERQDYS